MDGNIAAEINFFSHTIDGSHPWMDATPKLGWLGSNYARTPVRITIHDLRGQENIVNLDKNAFEILKYDSHAHDEFDDNNEALQCYYEDIITMLKQRLGASRIIVFNHVIRARGPSRPADECDRHHRNPVLYPHVDHDSFGAHFKLKELLGEEEANKMMHNRFQIINVWRPFGPNSIINTPLTICDYQSLDLDKDVHHSDIRESLVTVSLYTISHNIHNAQKWYYLSGMRADEMFIFKIFDSNPDVAKFAAHTAFINEYAPSTDIEQNSIELRCLVLYD